MRNEKIKMAIVRRINQTIRTCLSDVRKYFGRIFLLVFNIQRKNGESFVEDF